MRAEIKTVLLFGGLLIAVVVGSYLYSRSLQVGSPTGQTMAQPIERPEMHPDVQAGIDALNVDDLDRAEQLLEGVPVDDPGRVTALQHLGVLHLRREDPEASLEALLAALQLAPERPELYVGASWGYFRMQRFDDAETATLMALELDPRSVEARYNVGLFRVAQDDLARAVSSYERAMQLDAAGTGVERALGNLLRLRSMRPELPAVHYALAYFSNALDRPELEIEHLDDYLAFAPDGPVADQARLRLAAARERATP